VIKKVKTGQLKPGMFVHDFNCGWLQHPFFSSSAKLKDGKMVEKILESGIKEVYIDTDKGVDIADAPIKQEVDKNIQTEMRKVVKPETGDRNPASVKEEIGKAQEIKREAKQTVQTIMEDIRLGKQLEIEKADHVVDKMVDSIFRNKDALTNLGRIKKVDEYTFYHSVSVSVLLISFAKHLGFDPQLIKTIGIGGLLHDIGKMKIPIEILNKPGKLSDDEFKQIKDHATHSRTILEEYPDIDELSVFIAAQHHERFDGTGYPDGLKGDQINEFGRMAAIVDVYDAITSDRCYHRGMLPSEALKKLFEWSEFHFDKTLVGHFIRCMGIYPVGTLVRLHSRQIGVVMDHGEKSLLKPIVRIIYDIIKKKHIAPYVVDLSQPNGGVEDKIEGYEQPEKWGIKPEEYLLDSAAYLL
jgi:putative nucleotidyltransferase with HDIG domain